MVMATVKAVRTATFWVARFVRHPKCPRQTGERYTSGRPSYLAPNLRHRSSISFTTCARFSLLIVNFGFEGKQLLNLVTDF